MWTLYPDGSVRRAADGVTIVPDPANDLSAQRDYQAWLATGNTPLPAPTVPSPPPTVTGRQIKDQVTAGGYSAALVAFLTKAGQSGGPKPDDYIYWLGIALDTDIPTVNPKVGRVLVGAGVVDSDGSSAVPAFMAAALLLPA